MFWQTTAVCEARRERSRESEKETVHLTRKGKSRAGAERFQHEDHLHTCSTALERGNPAQQNTEQERRSVDSTMCFKVWRPFWFVKVLMPFKGPGLDEKSQDVSTPWYVSGFQQTPNLFTGDILLISLCQVLL